MYRKPSRSLTLTMVVLLALGNVPLLAAPSGANLETDLLSAVGVTNKIDLLRGDFALDAQASGLTVMDDVHAQAVGERVVQMGFNALGKIDFSETGVLFQRREFYLTPVNGDGEVAATRSFHVEIDAERELAFVSTNIAFKAGIDAVRGVDRYTGIEIQHTIQFPLDEYRKHGRLMAKTSDQQATIDAFTKRMMSHPEFVSETIVTGRDGQEIAVEGEVTISKAVALMVGAGDLEAMPGLDEKISTSCVLDCFEEQRVTINTAALLCAAAIVGLCGASCLFIGPACLACFQGGLLGCGIGTGGISLGVLIGCMLLC